MPGLPFVELLLRAAQAPNCPEVSEIGMVAAFARCAIKDEPMGIAPKQILLGNSYIIFTDVEVAQVADGTADDLWRDIVFLQDQPSALGINDEVDPAGNRMTGLDRPSGALHRSPLAELSCAR